MSRIHGTVEPPLRIKLLLSSSSSPPPLWGTFFLYAVDTGTWRGAQVPVPRDRESCVPPPPPLRSLIKLLLREESETRER